MAVSGGSDSLALLHLLVDRGAAGLLALTVDHRLRPEAAAEARQVALIARGLGVPHAILEWRGWDGRGNLLARARAARYRLLAGWCAARGIAHVALGHTLDDNVETLFLGLARGAGLDGLSGMRPRFRQGGVTFLRPLLGLSRAALRDGLARRGVAWMDDPSNEDRGFDRVRIRQALAGLPIAPERIAASIANLRATRRDLGLELLARLDGAIRFDFGDVVLDLARLAGMTAEFRRRTFAAALRFVSGSATAPRGADLMRLVGADWREPATLHGCILWPSADSLRISREFAAVADLSVPAGETWDNRWRMEGAPNPGQRIRALGPDGLRACAGCDRQGRPRHALLASPSLWEDQRLLAAPMPGFRASGAAHLRLVAENGAERFRALILSD